MQRAQSSPRKVPGDGYVTELVSKGLKHDKARNVVGDIKKCVDVVFRHMVGLEILD